MKTRLSTKLSQTKGYTRTELDWLLDHIGDPEPDLRDELVYASFCHALLDQLVNKEDIAYLFEQIEQRNLLFHQIPKKGQATLTRSFTALLLTLLATVDGDPTSPYFHCLSPLQIETLIDWSLRYLTVEHDAKGWHQDYGWSHALAHGADLLLSAGLHDSFPKERIPDLFETLHTCLAKQETVFTAGEDRRLARILFHLLLAKKLEETALLEWIQKLELEDHTPKDYFFTVNTENMLASLYLLLKKERQLSLLLAQAIETIWAGY